MRREHIPLFLIAALVAAPCYWMLYRIMLSLGAPAASARDTRTIVVAARRLQPGTVVRDADLSLQSWNGAVPAGVARTREELVGRAVAATIYEGEPVQQDRLGPRGAGGGYDVFLSSRSAQDGHGTFSGTLWQSMEVLSARQDSRSEEGAKPVSAQDAVFLREPAARRVRLPSENPPDTRPPGTPGNAPHTPRESAASRTAPPDPWVVEVINGVNRNERKFAPPVNP